MAPFVKDPSQSHCPLDTKPVTQGGFSSTSKGEEGKRDFMISLCPIIYEQVAHGLKKSPPAIHIIFI